jgi:hypothetical protein
VAPNAHLEVEPVVVLRTVPVAHRRVSEKESAEIKLRDATLYLNFCSRNDALYEKYLSLRRKTRLTFLTPSSSRHSVNAFP